jgi:hypothetical protein
MAGQTETVAQRLPTPNWEQIQRRHTLAAVVYFLYGLFYLFGAQYLTSMREVERGMSNASLFFIIGGVIAVLFPLLIYSRFALALSLWWKPQAQRKTFFLSFTLLLGILVVLRVLALVREGLYAKTPLHTAALIIAAINAVCLIRAGFSQPAWIARESQGPT